MSTSDDPVGAIVSPVMRHLAVADVARSLAFYRDILGFEERGVTEDYGLGVIAEVVCGPARIQFVPADDEAWSPAVVFFQTDDVSVLHETLGRRGGRPSALQKVNWIKMQLFEIRDPDGHTLWFGQSYQEPTPPAPPPMLRQIMPALPLDDVTGGVAHYRDVLGFAVNYQHDDLGVMDRDQARLLLIARTERHTGIGGCAVYVRDVDALYAELKAKGANVQGEPVSQPWGLREFRVLDLEGNEIAFAQTFE